MKTRAVADPYIYIAKSAVQSKDMASTEIHLIFVLRAVLSKPEGQSSSVANEEQ